jgi:hypothetical protein
MVEIENPDGSTSIVPFNQQVSSAINAGNINQGPRGVFVQGQAPAGQTAAPTLSNPPIMQPLAESGMLSQTPGRAASPSAPPGQVFTRAQVQAHAKKTGRDPAAIEADLRARGFTVQ